MNTRREFLWNSVLLVVVGGMPGALAAAMKYDRDGKTVRREFRINPDFTNRIEIKV